MSVPGTAEIEERLSHLDDILLGHVDCNTSTTVILVVMCLLGLLVSFFGYRLYVAALGLFAFLVAFCAEGALGWAWIAQDPRQETVKKVIVLICCLLWGSVAAVACCKAFKLIHKFIGFAVGAVIGAGVVALVIFIVQQAVDNVEGAAAYKGWEFFTWVTLGVPVALVVGYFFRNSAKIMLMVATAVAGAAVAVRTASILVSCTDADVEVLSRNIVQVAILAGIAVAGFAVQYFTQPKEVKEMVVVSVA